MRCLFCGHDTHGPFPYCDATCELDHELADEPIEPAPQESEIGEASYYTPDDEPADPLAIDA